MEELICPKCRHLIDFKETIDEYTDDDIHEILCSGGCPHCGIDYQWREIYKFSHIEKLEEVK